MICSQRATALAHCTRCGVPHERRRVALDCTAKISEYVLRKVPHSWDDVVRRHQGVLSESFAELIRSKFADVVDSTIEEFEKSEFERLLPREVQNDAMRYRECVRLWKDMDEQVTQAFNAFAQDFHGCERTDSRATFDL